MSISPLFALLDGVQQAEREKQTRGKGDCSKKLVWASERDLGHRDKLNTNKSGFRAATNPETKFSTNMLSTLCRIRFGRVMLEKNSTDFFDVQQGD